MRHVSVIVLLGLCNLLTACETSPATLRPAGPGAALIADLSWIVLWLGGAVYLLVMGLLVVALVRTGQKNDSGDSDRDEPSDLHVPNRFLFLSIGGTFVILMVVLGFSLTTHRALSTPAGARDLTINVIGKQWWWDVRYPDHSFITANEIHIPAGQPVTLHLTSEDVIHSFWVPELQGKLDMVPGEVNTFWLDADEPGVYLGLCAEFCGLQHTKMRFLVIAHPPDEFDGWLQQQQQAASAPQSELAQRGQQVFMDAACDACHTVRGTAADGRLGPDLTHLASRRTLAAGVLANTRGNLAGWVVDPQHIKKASLMPAAPDLSGEELQALLAYLESLE